MPSRSDYYTHGHAHRSLQKPGSIRPSQDVAFTGQSCYYETDDASSHSTAPTSRSTRHESKFEGSISHLEDAFRKGVQSPLQLLRLYSLHILVAIIVYMFLFGITVRLPFLLAFTIAIPYVHTMLTPTPPTLHETTCESASEEALYRRSSINSSAVPGEPTAHYTSHAGHATFPGLTFFSPSTWFPRATDPIGSRHKRLRLHTTFRESAYQPRRTFREALEDTGPRLLSRWGAFVVETICFQIASRFAMRILQATYEALSGEAVNDHFVHMYVMNVFHFYRDWTVGIGSIVWYLVRRLVGGVLVSVGKQIMTVAGVVEDKGLEYGDVNASQF